MGQASLDARLTAPASGRGAPMFATLSGAACAPTLRAKHSGASTTTSFTSCNPSLRVEMLRDGLFGSSEEIIGSDDLVDGHRRRPELRNFDTGGEIGDHRGFRGG